MKNICRYILLALAAILMAGCAQVDRLIDDGQLSFVSVSTPQVNAASTEAGYTLLVRSNAEWSIALEGNDEGWFSVEPMSEKGEAEITVTILANDGISRTGTIIITSASGAVQRVAVSQSGFGLYAEHFGATTITAPIEVSSFDGWERGGYQQTQVAYTASAGVKIASLPTSSGAYVGNSGGNMLEIPDGSSLTVSNIKSYGRDELILTFGVACYDRTVGAFNPLNPASGELKVWASLNGVDWSLFDYTLSEVSSPMWQVATAELGMPSAGSVIHLRLDADADVSVLIDDLRLDYGGEAAGQVGDFTDHRVTTGAASQIGTNSFRASGYYATGAASVVAEKYFEYWQVDGSGTEVPGTRKKVAADPSLDSGTAFYVLVADDAQTPVSDNTPYEYVAVIKYAPAPGQTQVTLEGDVQALTTIEAELDITATELRTMIPGILTRNYFLNGYVVSDAASGNIPSMRYLYVNDDTGSAATPDYTARGIAVELAQAPALHPALGARVRIRLMGSTLSAASPMIITGVAATDVAVSEGKTPAPLKLTAAQLASGDYESMLVSVDNVQLDASMIPSTGQYATFVHDGIATALAMNFPASGSLLPLNCYTYPAAVFAATVAPFGAGTLTGILSPQGVMPRSAADFAALTAKRLSADGNPLPVSFTNFAYNGVLVGGQPVSGTITMDYFNADPGTPISVTVTPTLVVSGVESGPFSGMAEYTFPVNYAASGYFGALTLNLSAASWTPTQTGTVRFKMTSGAILNAAVDKSCKNPEPAKPVGLASWTFDYGGLPGTSIPRLVNHIMPEMASTGSSDHAGLNAMIYAEGGIRNPGFGTIPNETMTVSATNPNRLYLLLNGFCENSAWVMRIPMKSVIKAGSQIEVSSTLWVLNTGQVAGGANSPGQWKYSLTANDGAVYAEHTPIPTDSPNSYFRIASQNAGPDAPGNVTHTHTRTITVPQEIDSDDIYIRAVAVSNASVTNPSVMIPTGSVTADNNVRIGFITITLK